MNNDSAIPHTNPNADKQDLSDSAAVVQDVNTQGGDFIGRDQTIEGDYIRGDKIIIADVVAPRSARNRTTMLQLVHRVWVEGVLDQALADNPPINIRLNQQMDAVDQSAWSNVIDLPQQPELPLPLGTQIIDIFEQMDQSLLILGEPGTGKTILLLMLARDTIVQAAQDAQRSIPVVLNLSAWGIHRQPLDQWLVDELRVKYNIPKRIATDWVEQDDLLLLLDGLDEVPELYRDACVQAINQFRQDHLTPMAVCCRLADYRALPTKLKLNGAVVLQSLSSEQIAQYLRSAGPTLAGLREALEKDNVLQELAQTPLMLNIMALAYHDLPHVALDTERADSIEARRQHLFDTYVARMFTRTVRTKHNLYPQVQTIQWLSWIAKMLTQHGQSTFLIEELQATCLTLGQQRLYQIGSRVICGLLLILVGVIGYLCAAWLVSIQSDRSISLAQESVAALLFGLVYALTFGLASVLVTSMSTITALLVTCGLATLVGTLFAGELLFGIFIGVLFGLPGGFAGISLANNRRIELSETLRWSWRRGLLGLLLGGLFAIGFGILMSDQGEPFSLLANLLAIGPPVAFICALIWGVRRTEFVGIRLQPNQGFFQARRNTFWLGSAVLLFTILVTLSVGLFLPSIFYGSLAVGVGFGLPLAAITALYVGGGACIQHMVLRLLLLSQGTIPRNLTHFLDWAVSLIFLRRTGGGYIFLHRTLVEYFSSK